MSNRAAYMRGWATTAVQQGQTPTDAVREAERAWKAFSAAEDAVRDEMNPTGRRREDRVISCLACGDTLGIYVEGEQPPTTPHDCPEIQHRPRIEPETAVEAVTTPNELKGA